MSDEMHLLAGKPEGLFDIRSDDGGKTWAAPDKVIGDVEVAAIVQAPDGSVYAGTRGRGLFCAQPGLGRWDQMRTPPGLDLVRSLCFAGDAVLVGNEAAEEPVGVFEWDGGEHWRGLADMAATCSGSKEWHYPVATEGVHIRHLARDPHQPERIYAAIQVGGVGISPDGGESWYDRRNLDCDVHMIEPHPTRAGVVFAGSGGGGLYKSTDYGDTWQCISQDCGNFVVQFLIDPSDPDRLYLGTGRGSVPKWRTDPAGARGEVFRSDDCGEHWQKLAGGLPGEMRSRVNAMAIDRTDPRHVFFSGGHTKGEATSGVHHSADQGESWRSIAALDEVVSLCCVRT